MRWESVGSEVAKVVAAALPGLVVVGEHGAFGTGLIWDQNGLVVTNDHVAQSERPRIAMFDGREVEGRVIARDRRNDLAAVSVPTTGLGELAAQASAEPRLGQLVLALGHPLGVKDSIAMGIISGASNGAWMGSFYRRLLHADLRLAPGNSGGPILDVHGKVIGIACMVASPGIALVVPGDVVAEFMDRLRRRNAA